MIPATPHLLRHQPLLSSMSAADLASLAEASRVRSVAAGEILAREDEPLSGFFLVLEGRIKLSKSALDGREQTLTIFGPGEPFCLCAMFACQHLPAAAQALEPSRVLWLEAGAFESLARREPQLLLAILAVVTGRLKEAFERIEQLSLLDIPARVAAFLLHEAASQPVAQRRLRLPFAHRELAKIVGVTPEALSRALKRMKDHGLLAVEGREVVLRDRAGLEACASGQGLAGGTASEK